MKALALILALSCATAFAEPPADAPVMRRVEGGYFLNDAGYRVLQAETDRLQLEEARLSRRVAELERRNGATALTAPAVVALVSTSLALGIVAGFKLKELTR